MSTFDTAAPSSESRPVEHRVVTKCTGSLRRSQGESEGDEVPHRVGTEGTKEGNQGEEQDVGCGVLRSARIGLREH